MNILVAPSQTISNCPEKFGPMLIEAFACGVPVIGSDSSEIPDVIQDAGLVVGEKDEWGCIAAIYKLLNSPSRRQELAIKGLEISHTLYAWTSVAKQDLQFFTELLNKNKYL